MVDARAEAQMLQWDKRWAREQAARAAQSARRAALNRKEAARQYKEEMKAEAEARTEDAQRAHEALQRILEHTLSVDDRIDFDSLKHRAPFPERAPAAPAPVPYPAQPSPVRSPPHAPAAVSLLAGLWESLSPATRERRLAGDAAAQAAIDQADHARHAGAVAAWNQEAARIHASNVAAAQAHAAAHADFERRRRLYVDEQERRNAAIDHFAAAYRAYDPDAIQQCCELVLQRSEYPDELVRSFDVRYRAETKMLLVEYVLPAPSDLPSAKTVKYVQARDELVETSYSEKERRSLYESVVSQSALRTLHELFEADAVDALEAIAFNGFVETIDRGTGNSVRPCILSLNVTKKDFLALNLAAVEPKACLKRLKGVYAADLNELVPVPPIVQFDKNDDRFVDARDVMSELDEGTNLAAMKWEDFEHLVRQLLEVEFATVGGEVKVTQSSRDGGIDAVIFDPDPLRGGKFVVQAKRYTKTVPVSSVRDLYGTMLNEGAGKGILVTTAQFGADSYEFAKDKPITLLNGGNLLAMMERHGMRAHIDKEAARRARAAKSA